jgi:HEAT repeat protein
VSISGVCCDSSRLIIYIGVAEVPGSGFHYRRVPTGESVLPDVIVASAEQFELALYEAAHSGIAGDDFSEGHSLMEYAPARAIQEQFVLCAEQHGEILRHVLHQSANAQHRATAAMVLAYTKDKTKIVEDLIQAVRDPDEEVRNNATRALGTIARFANNNPSTGISIQAEPFIGLLNSTAFGDRNKGVMVLLALTEHRPSELLDRLQVQALPSLIEMCRWKSWGHAAMACLVLQRITGLPDQDESGAREPTIELAKKLLPP